MCHSFALQSNCALDKLKRKEIYTHIRIYVCIGNKLVEIEERNVFWRGEKWRYGTVEAVKRGKKEKTEKINKCYDVIAYYYWGILAGNSIHMWIGLSAIVLARLNVYGSKWKFLDGEIIHSANVPLNKVERMARYCYCCCCCTNVLTITIWTRFHIKCINLLSLRKWNYMNDLFQ